jgi:deazaflavin-dependent oxidoreductase (nitroreductase family)
MATKSRIPNFFWQLMKLLNRHLAARASQKRMSHLVLLLTTTGRKSGLPRLTPLQYEEIDGVYYIGSARGTSADWYQNLVADPNVEVEIQGRCMPALAEAITDPTRIADFLEVRLARRPRMIRLMLRAEGLKGDFDRHELEALATGKALVALHPQQSEPHHKNELDRKISKNSK